MHAFSLSRSGSLLARFWLSCKCASVPAPHPDYASVYKCKRSVGDESKLLAARTVCVEANCARNQCAPLASPKCYGCFCRCCQYRPWCRCPFSYYCALRSLGLQRKLHIFNGRRRYEASRSFYHFRLNRRGWRRPLPPPRIQRSKRSWERFGGQTTFRTPGEKSKVASDEGFCWSLGQNGLGRPLASQSAARSQVVLESAAVSGGAVEAFDTR